MKSTTSKVELENAINLVGKALVSKISGEDGTICLIEHDDELKLITTNECLTIEAAVNAETLDPFAKPVRVNGKLFSETVRKAADGDITLEQVGNHLSIIHADGKTTIPLLDGAGKARALDEKTVDTKITIDASKFKDIAKRVIPFCSTDNVRPVLKGVNFSTEGITLTAVSCDGFRLAKVVVECVRNGERDINVTVPATAINVIAAIIDDGSKIEIGLSSTGNFIVVYYNGIKVTSRLLNGDYINYENFFPKSFKTTAEITRIKLLATLERTVLLGGDNNLARFAITDGKLRVTAATEDGSLDDSVTIDNDGNAVNIAFNAKFITQALKTLSCDDVNFECNRPNDPAIFRNGNTSFLILPVRQIGE